MKTLRDIFWILALGIIACFLFFFALGGFGLGDAIGVTLVVALLSAMWMVHAALMRRQAQHHRDARLTSARERRGF